MSELEKLEMRINELQNEFDDNYPLEQPPKHLVSEFYFLLSLKEKLEGTENDKN